MEDYLPGALTPANDAFDAAPAAPPDADGVAPSGGLSKAERDHLAQMGRQNADAQRRAVAAEARAARAEQVANGLVVAEQRKEAQARDSYLRSLPPPQRAQEEMRFKVAELEQRMSQPQPAPIPVVRQEPSQDEIRRQAQALLTQVNQEYGVQLTGSEQELDWGGAAEFRASARALASAHRRYSASDDNEPAERPQRAAGRPVSATPTGGARAPVTAEDYQKAQWNHDSRKGIMSTRAAQQAIRDRAATRVR